MGSTGIVPAETPPAETGRASTPRSLAESDRQSSIGYPFSEKWTLDMSIAQHTVAGEDDAHLIATDTEALAAFTSDVTNLPWLTFRAVHRANQIQQIPARARAALAALARTVDAKKPFASIYAGRELLTGRALLSHRTFYRALNDLDQAGLVERLEQSRYVAVGKFGRAYLHLTTRAAALLGLVPMAKQVQTADQSTASASSSESSAEPSVPAARDGIQPADEAGDAPNVIDGSNGADYAADPAGASFTGPYANMAHGRIQGDLYPSSFQNRQPGQLPRDLERLCPLGIHRFMVFKLMAEARRAGKRLSDIVEHTWDFLKNARKPIAYLRKLFQSPVDFSYAVATKRAEAAAEQRARDAAEEASALARRSAGQTFYSPDGAQRFDVAPDATGMTLTAAKEGVTRGMGYGWEVAFAEAVAAGRALPATDDLLTLFDAHAAQHRKPIAAKLEETPIARRELTTAGDQHLVALRALVGIRRSAALRASA